MKTTMYLSDKVTSIEPYQWEGSAVKQALRFDSNTMPSPPPGVAVFLRDMKKFCPINEYTDPGYRSLRAALSGYESVPVTMITVTNSGDEAIDILAKTFLNPGDVFVTAPPTYEMYSILCSLNNGINLEIPTDSTFRVNDEKIIQASRSEKVKIIFLANPNNPTGAVSPPDVIERIIAESDCIVVVDEAYGEFYGRSAVPLIRKYPNLVILKSFSKFAGLAGARIGYLIANNNMSRIFDSIRFPMGVSYLSAKLAETVLRYDSKWIADQISSIKTERSRVTEKLTEMGCAVFPSEANFLLVRIGTDAYRISKQLNAGGFLIRDKSSDPGLTGCVRITIRSRKENNQLLNTLKGIL
jgi:histidinol-phosphate aminotransferase